MRYLILAVGLAGMVATALCARTAFAQAAPAPSALINKALDEQVMLQLDDALPAAMERIREQTGVPLKADPAVWDLLPWGRDTKLQAKIENVTLRQALEVITRKLGLMFVLRDDHVEIQPMPGLHRLGQRATRNELVALDLLASRPLNLGQDRPTVEQLLLAVDLKLAEEKETELAIENRIGDVINTNQTVFVPRNATLMDALESLVKETNATWYPWGSRIVVVTKEDRTRRLLSKPLVIRAGPAGLDLQQLLIDISQRTGVAFEYEPGVLRRLPAESRIIRGVDGNPPILENVPAQQILEQISAATGLEYTVQGDKVIISSGTAAAGGVRDRALGFIQLDNGMQVMVPTSQVPEDVREYIRYKTQREIEKIRQMMIEEGFKPSPPTTQPVEEEARPL